MYQSLRISYEKPNFKKYGTMKGLTLNSSGSGGITKNDNDVTKINDAKRIDDGDSTLADAKK